MKEKAIFLAKWGTIGIPLMVTSFPLHWMLRGGTRLYGLMCKAIDNLVCDSHTSGAIEAWVLIDDLRKASGNLSKKEFFELIDSYYNAFHEIED